MDRDEDVTVELPVVETDAPPDRVYVPPKTAPPKTKVATLEMDTVQVQPQSEPNSRQAPTVRLRRRGPSPPAVQDVPTDRPGQVWRQKSEAPPNPPGSVAARAGRGDAQDAVTQRLELPDASQDVREAVTQSGPSQPHDPRDAATLSASELQAMGTPPVFVMTPDSGRAVTPRPESRITDEELEAIQSARTLEVRHTPKAPSVVEGIRRRGAPALLVAGGVLLGILIVWVAILLGRSSRPAPTPADVSAVSALPPTSQLAAPTATRGQDVAPARASAQAPAPDVTPLPRESVPMAHDEPAATPTTSPPALSKPSDSAAEQRPRAIY